MLFLKIKSIRNGLSFNGKPGIFYTLQANKSLFFSFGVIIFTLNQAMKILVNSVICFLFTAFNCYKTIVHFQFKNAKGKELKNLPEPL